MTFCGARVFGGFGDDFGIHRECAQQLLLAFVHEQREVDRLERPATRHPPAAALRPIDAIRACAYCT